MNKKEQDRNQLDFRYQGNVIEVSSWNTIAVDSMKSFLAIFLFVLPVIGQQVWTAVDLRVNGIRSGTANSKIVKKIGKPLRTRNDGIDECGDSGVLKSLYYSGLTIGVLSDAKGRNFKVISIEVTSRKWAIAPGIRIGANKRTVRAKYGKPVASRESDQNRLTYVTKDNLGLVTFDFKGNKLVKVTMHETLC